MDILVSKAMKIYYQHVNYAKGYFFFLYNVMTSSINSAQLILISE